MAHAYVIQIAGRTAGIAARDHSGQAFHFFASNHLFRTLEGVAFPEPHLAERAARQIQKYGWRHLAPHAATETVERGARRNPPVARGI
jgi:hypothetical protein